MGTNRYYTNYILNHCESEGVLIFIKVFKSISVISASGYSKRVLMRFTARYNQNM